MDRGVGLLDSKIIIQGGLGQIHIIYIDQYIPRVLILCVHNTQTLIMTNELKAYFSKFQKGYVNKDFQHLLHTWT